MFHGEPEMRGMSLAGYDIVTPGNHEFDVGAETYKDALNLNNYTYNLWEPYLRGEIDNNTINNFKITIWSSPFWGPNSIEQSVLINYLDEGGRLFISGQDIGWSIGGTRFYQDYLSANFINDDMNLYVLNGVSGDPITQFIDISISGGDGANNQWWPSEIDPISPAVSIFYYDNTTYSAENLILGEDRKSTRLNSSHIPLSRMPSSA